MEHNLNDYKQVLPPGLVNTEVEFFLDDHCSNNQPLSISVFAKTAVKCLTEGKTYSFENFPTRVKEIMDADMEQHPVAIDCLIDWGFTDADSQMKQYIACRHGGFDGKPDIAIDGLVQPSEYVACGLRGQCKYEGKLCTSIQLVNGALTRSEISVLIEVGNGYLDKEIADRLNISAHTVRHHKDSICRKSGLERKPALAGLAIKLGLVSC